MTNGTPQYTKIVAEDKRAVAYRPNFARLTGSVTSAILLQQILFHFDKNDSKPFYKFRAVPKKAHKLYKQGDSWCEELAFTPTEFDSALKKIGTKASKKFSKQSILNWKLPELADWKDDSAGYAAALVIAVGRIVAYWTDGKRVTWYQVNTELLNQFLGALYDPNSGIMNYISSSGNLNYKVNQESSITYITKKTQRKHKEESPPAQSAAEKPSDSKPDDFFVKQNGIAIQADSYADAQRIAEKGGTITQRQALKDELIEKNKQGLLFQAWVEELGKDTLPAAFAYKPYMRFMLQLVKDGYEPPDLTCAASLFKAWLKSHPGRVSVDWAVGAVTTAIRRALDLCKSGICSEDVSAFVTARYAEVDSKGNRFWAGKLVKFDHVAENVANWKAERQPVKSVEMERVTYPDGTYTLRPKS